jgi:hypothetical protein
MRTTRFSIYREQRILGQRCKAAGLTRWQVAESLRMAPSTVGGWLAGVNRMPDPARALVEFRLAEIERSRQAHAGTNQ